MINKDELAKARIAWGEGIVAISKVFEEKGIKKASTTANEILDDLYGFEFGPILFKPTLSGGVQTFRTEKEGTLSYFIGNNPKYPQDTGFGIKSWHKVESETSSIFINENIAMWMGWVTFIDRDGQVTKVDKSWGYKLDDHGDLRITLHHSSLPYEI